LRFFSIAPLYKAVYENVCEKQKTHTPINNPTKQKQQAQPHKCQVTKQLNPNQRQLQRSKPVIRTTSPDVENYENGES
jgi:hypothetical protein